VFLDFKSHSTLKIHRDFQLKERLFESSTADG